MRRPIDHLAIARTRTRIGHLVTLAVTRIEIERTTQTATRTGTPTMIGRRATIIHVIANRIWNGFAVLDDGFDPLSTVYSTRVRHMRFSLPRFEPWAD